MSEFLKNPPYSLNAQVVTERFAQSPEIGAEMMQRGEVETNNLGMRMHLFECGPDSPVGKVLYDVYITPRNYDLLEMARALEPELWEKTMEVHNTRTALITEYAQTVQEHGLAAASTLASRAKCMEIEQQNTELKTQIFQVLDPHMTVDEAIEICV